MRCPDTERVESGGVEARALVMDIKAPKPTSASWKLTVNPLPFNISASPLQPQHVIMVCTRKKDYGDAPPPKQRKPSSIRKNTTVVKGPDAVAEAGLLDDSRGTLEKSRNNTQLPYSEFTLFQKLPCELRLMIWEASMTPRFVPIERWPKGKKSGTLVFPALLSVNKESRYRALPHYTLRFSITVTADQMGMHRWGGPNHTVDTYHAHVLMSPDDTLCFMGWEDLGLGRRHEFRVESADGTSPWESHPTVCGAQPDVRKVAYLRPGIASTDKLVHDLNSTISGDLNSILHTEPGRIRKLYTVCGPWYRASEAADSKHHILIHSRGFTGSLREWGQELILKANMGDLPLGNGAPDIAAFELGKKLTLPPAHYERWDWEGFPVI
ncbi:hypothetical protein INS49_014200 [Diaporthe citri]|uniref:uncharacterized protein n=1 Tax=Diaporthe citri TaxID=83186 RepID=UPI001C80936D|nr:uncharacterized protein INS49_014200 [Diaporthe citri]KAG6358316.1 hypothetical protein INS49_014200 [Diaporthe citri]